MISILRTTSDNKDFTELVKQLDAFLAEVDGAEHAFYAQLNKTNTLKHVVVAYEDDKPVACGAIREFDPTAMEVKRMYTLPAYRGKGLASKVLTELEAWSTELGYTKCILETGLRQPEAIHLYEKSGYRRIPNYGKYSGMGNSVCFERKIKPL